MNESENMPEPPPEPKKKPVPSAGWKGFGIKSGKPGSVQIPPDLFKSSSWGGSSWEWHITETFKGLIQLSVEVVKMLALVNGGAIIALLAYLGNFATHVTDKQPPHLRHAFGYFANGLFATVLAVLFAYLAQLRLYREEWMWHNTGKRPYAHHEWILAIGILLSVYAAFVFLKGCLTASSAISRNL
jgi:hypothetical protein